MSEMNDKKQTLRDILIVSVGELICLGLIYGAFALLHRLDGKVLLGGALGALTAILNYFLLAVSVFSAADRAAAGDPARGKRILSLSMAGRFLLMVAVLVVGAKSGACNVIAMVIPLALFRSIIFIGEFFRRKDG